VYQPKGGAREVKIDHYERKRDLLISEISKRTSELRIPRYEYKGAQGRRDPWVDPRVPVNVDGQIMLTIEEQIAIVDALVQKAAEARALWRVVEGAENLIEEMKARADVEEKLAVLEEEVRRIETDNQLTFVPAERRFENDVVAVMSELRTRMTGTEQTGGPSLTALTEAAEAMERHLESGEYELAIDTFRAIEPRLGMAERDERKLPLVQALHELDRLAKTVIEFEAIRLDINGIAIYEDRRPVALINGTAVAEGELLGEELLVRNISPDQIEFSFRGMVLAVPVEASHDGSIPQNGRRR
jgi:hypothetical protein